MGCCNSAPRSPSHSPYQSSPQSPRPVDVATNTHTFSRAPLINPSHGPMDAINTATSNSVAKIPNAPLRKPSVWTSHKRTWTHSALSKEREEFFDTRVTGRTEIWGVVKLVVESLRQGDMAGAQGVLDASGCTCPTGDVTEGIFDERGALYPVPEWVLSDPQNTVDDTWNGEFHEEEGVDPQELNDIKRDEKGKGKVVEVKNAVKIRARLSDRGTDVVVMIEKDQNVKVLIRRVQEEAGISESTKVKLAYLGKILKDNKSLPAQGWQSGHVVNALIFE